MSKRPLWFAVLSFMVTHAIVGLMKKNFYDEDEVDVGGVSLLNGPSGRLPAAIASSFSLTNCPGDGPSPISAGARAGIRWPDSGCSQDHQFGHHDPAVSVALPRHSCALTSRSECCQN